MDSDENITTPELPARDSASPCSQDELHSSYFSLEDERPRKRPKNVSKQESLFSSRLYPILMHSVVQVEEEEDHDASDDDFDCRPSETPASQPADADNAEMQPPKIELKPDPASPTLPPSEQTALFNTDDLELQPLYDELKALLETEQASDDEDDEETYEQKRQRKLRQNELLLAQLGLNAPSSQPRDHHEYADESFSAIYDSSPARKPGRKRKGRPAKDHRQHGSEFGADLNGDSQVGDGAGARKHERRIRFADDGTTISAPKQGDVFTLAYVDLPVLRDRARNDYLFVRDVPDPQPEDYEAWSESEAGMPESDADSEPASKKKIKRRRASERGPVVMEDGMEMSSCHQCRRKTARAKMHCRRCTLHYDFSCLSIRYGIESDPDGSREFDCPRCLGYCNCTVCLARSGLGDLLGTDGGQRAVSLSHRLRDSSGHVKYDNVRDYIKALLSNPEERHKLVADALHTIKQDRDKPESKSNSKSKPKSPGKRRGRPPKTEKS
ncbi:hypothetical protein BCV70DRAFT_35301 [Testicularia cyperi]|uniref:Zinc-finger domain-containing protein n=1 Tax=Testicularia cyperi TaxID=1882483 RepID=A0A317XIU3_9BASI|nr:hypothetical protein BCV70DRAFT_35301 [Testicularia cyperi]